MQADEQKKRMEEFQKQEREAQSIAKLERLFWRLMIVLVIAILLYILLSMDFVEEWIISALPRGQRSGGGAVRWNNLS